MTDRETHLSIDRLRVVYKTTRGTLEAIRDISLDIREREFVAVLGPSGCGKSTLLNIVSGLLPPSGGSVRMGGQEVSGPRRDVGIVFQAPTLLPWKTVLENVLVPVRTLGLPLETYRPRALDLLRLVGLEGFAQHYPRELSGGMQQRVGIARGLVHDPAVILMDEPFAALDAMTREHMSHELQELWMRERKSILFITHSIPEAVFLADRVVVLGDRPAMVREVVEVPIPRPRRIETMAAPEFAAVANHLRTLFAPVGAGVGAGATARREAAQ
jgi:NitT/TauT family transport system ATP-binding protein